MTTKKSQACGLKSWVFGYATLHGNGVSLDLKKSKGLLGSAVLQKCQSLFAAWPEMQRPMLSRQLLQTNNSSIKPLVLGHKPQLAGQLCPARLTEVRDFRRLWNDNKEKSGMWSEVMGLWV